MSMWVMPRSTASRRTASRAVVVGGRSDDARAGELHGAVADPGDGQVRPGSTFRREVSWLPCEFLSSSSQVHGRPADTVHPRRVDPVTFRKVAHRTDS